MNCLVTFNCGVIKKKIINNSSNNNNNYNNTRVGACNGLLIYNFVYLTLNSKNKILLLGQVCKRVTIRLIEFYPMCRTL